MLPKSDMHVDRPVYPPRARRVKGRLQEMLWLPGSRGEQEAALRLERARLVGLCTRLTGDSDVAEDLAQETLYEALRNAHKLRDPCGRSQWLSAIARNVCRCWSDKQGRERRHIVLAGTEAGDSE